LCCVMPEGWGVCMSVACRREVTQHLPRREVTQHLQRREVTQH